MDHSLEPLQPPIHPYAYQMMIMIDIIAIFYFKNSYFEYKRNAKSTKPYQDYRMYDAAVIVERYGYRRILHHKK